jgi:hypothetical protein
MFKIVYPICCGIDVHKTFVVATSAATDKKNITTCITQRFSPSPKIGRASRNGFRITLAHPRYVKAIRGKKKSTKISRAGVYIKPVLVQCALAVISDKSFPHYRQRQEALKHRPGHRKALIAIARMMLTAIFVMLTSGERFNPQMYEESLRKPACILSPGMQLAHLAKRLGYSVVKVPDLIE